MVKRIIRYWLKGEWCVIVDVPLLIEAGMWKWVGDTVVVYVYVLDGRRLKAYMETITNRCLNSNERLQLSRLLSRQSNPPLTQSQASSRIASQLPLSAKLSYATSVIDNSGSFSDLNDQVDRTVAKWKAQQGGDSGWWWRVCWLVPPVGLVAGALSLLAIWRKSKKDRRRGRGEVSRRDGSEQAPERIELMELKGRRRRATNGSSVTDKE